MPVIVIGADTRLGPAVIDALLPRQGEVRAFVTDESAAEELRGRGVKVAIGDVSDGSHIGGAALNAFCAVLLVEAATDDRIRSFAPDSEGVLDAWAEGLDDAGVKRAIFVPGPDGTAPTPALVAATAEFVTVDPANGVATTAARIAALDDAPTV